MAEIAAQNAGLEALIKKVLDWMSDLDSKVDGLQNQITTSTDRADQLEARLESAIPPHQADGKATATPEVNQQGTKGQIPTVSSQQILLLRTEKPRRRAHLRRARASGQVTAATTTFAGVMLLGSLGTQCMPREQVPFAITVPWFRFQRIQAIRI